MTVESNIIPVNIEDEIKHSYMDYAMSVIIGRALPDVRDGLKPVHRRILYAMHELGNRWNASYKKSARVVGDVIGKYHPHGDSAVYDALVRLAQDFNMRVPLVDGQGNFGSVDGDPAAAMRYTEVRMARAASELLADIGSETVDYGPNYDDSLFEPLVLPTRIPNLLVNGSEGIAVGMATKIPPHNLREVVDATIALIQDPELTVQDLMGYVRGPDFPTGGFICGREGIEEAFTTGRGKVIMRARVEVEERARGREALIITELPFQVNKAKLVEKIADLVRDKKIEDISDLRDESDRRGMRVVIELKTGSVPMVVLNNLYKMTPMQQTFGVIMLAIVAGQPQVMDLKEVLSHFYDFRRDVVTRRTLYLLRQAQAREHIVEGLVTALDHIDQVISTIRASPDTQTARERLMDQFLLSERQAQAILDMRLQKLTGLERDKLLTELEELRNEISELKRILTDDNRLNEVIVEELEAVRDQYGTDRLTEILNESPDFDPLALIADEDMVVTVSHAGYIKRNPLSDYRKQIRGGKGKRGMSTRDEDFVEDIFVASTHDSILVFTSFGRVFKLGVHDVPQASRTARGKAIINLLRFDPDEKVRAILPIQEFSDHEYLIFSTRSGQVKRTALSEYSNIHAGGLIAINLRDKDDLIDVRLVEEDQDVFLASRDGKAIRFSVADVRPMGRNTQGVRGLKLVEKDEVVGMVVLKDNDANILTVCENGYGKRTQTSEYPEQRRGGQGVITIKTSDRNGPVVAIRQVLDDDELIMISNAGQIIRTGMASIPVLGRNTQGVKLFSLGDEEQIVGVARVVDEDEEAEEGEDGEGLEAAGDAGEGDAGEGDEGEGASDDVAEDAAEGDDA
ncbi:MAG: DNA gyrase subunit A [Myxococcales bacterium]|nr:DNA gyrase subunit A [Myxococcales bacterium]